MAVKCNRNSADHSRFSGLQPYRIEGGYEGLGGMGCAGNFDGLGAQAGYYIAISSAKSV